MDAFRNRKNVQRIKLANFHLYSTLDFLKFTDCEVREKILNLSFRKATKNGNIPAKILKKNVYIKETTFIIHDYIENGIFPDNH